MNRREMLNQGFKSIAKALPSVIAAATGLEVLNKILLPEEAHAEPTAAACFPRKKQPSEAAEPENASLKEE